MKDKKSAEIKTTIINEVSFPLKLHIAWQQKLMLFINLIKCECVRIKNLLSAKKYQIFEMLVRLFRDIDKNYYKNTSIGFFF